MTRKIGSRYTVTRVIGRGTCGTVWEGVGPDGPVAVKLLREDLAADQTLIARFVQERTVLTSLVHPNVVAVRDLVVDGADLALVMDLVRGTDLRGRLEAARSAHDAAGLDASAAHPDGVNSPERLPSRIPKTESEPAGHVTSAASSADGLPPAEAAALAADVAAGLAAAHARGVVHRDVKPENILLDADSGTARLTDFGIARIIDGPRRTRATRIVGTPDYLAPEIIEGCPPGPPVDVYALGTLIFELLTGWTPFGGGHPGAVLRRHVTETAPDIPGMPEPLAEILSSCLSKAPAARLTAAEVAGRLRMLVPDLAGLPALRIADPRAVADQAAGSADTNGSGRPAALMVGSVPLVSVAADAADDSRQTHMNLMRPIREPLGPSAPVPGSAQSGRGRPDLASESDSANLPDRDQSPARSSRKTRIITLVAAIAVALVAAGGYLFWHGRQNHNGQQPVGSTRSESLTSVAKSDAVGSGSTASTATASAAADLSAPVGALGLVSFGKVAAPPVNAVGAVHFAAAGTALLLVMTGTDGVVRYATAWMQTSQGPLFSAWQPLPGVSSTTDPAIVGRTSGEAEIYVVSSADSQIHRAVFSPATSDWSSWSTLSGVGMTQLAGPPAAVALDANHTELLVASAAGTLLVTTGSELALAAGAWQSWHTISAAGTIKPGVALAARADGTQAGSTQAGFTQAVFVVRASDSGVLRLLNSGSSAYTWESAFSTGASGQPEAAFNASGRPYLFVRSAANDVQVYEPSGGNLRGAPTVLPAGVASFNPPGVAVLPDLRLIVTTTGADGAVRLYASTV